MLVPFAVSKKAIKGEWCAALTLLAATLWLRYNKNLTKNQKNLTAYDKCLALQVIYCAIIYFL